MKFWKRKIKLQIEDRDVGNLDCEFQAKKSINPLQPNTLKLRVFNLNEDHRKALEVKKNRVIFEAGYEDDMVQIFNGQTRSAYSLKEEGHDWVTYLDTGDSFMEVALAQQNVNMGPKATQGATLKAVAGSMGVKLGNLDFMLAKLGKLAEVTHGKRGVFSGNAGVIMSNLCDSAGLEWSVQNGELQVLKKGEPLEGLGVVLNADSGLVGSPSLELKSAGSFSNPIQVAKSIALSKPGHLVTATCLIHPGLRVGGKVIFNTQEIKAAYRILELEYKGQTRGADWHVKLTGSHYNQAGF